MKARFYPQLQGVAHPLIDLAIRVLYDDVYDLRDGQVTPVVQAAASANNATPQVVVVSGGGGGGNNAVALSETSVWILSAHSTLAVGVGTPAVPPPVLGDRLILTVREAPPGGFLLTGTDGNFEGVDLNLDPTANAATVYAFDAILSGANSAVWFQTAPQRMGMSL